MGDYRQCPTCREWGWPGHKCAPLWDWRYFWRDDEADEWIIGELRAHDAEGATDAAARAYDNEDYPLSRGGSVVIDVRRTETEEVTRWTARAECEPVYYVKQEPPHGDA